MGLLPDVLERGPDEHLGLEVGDDLAEVVDQAQRVVADHVQQRLQHERGCARKQALSAWRAELETGA